MREEHRRTGETAGRDASGPVRGATTGRLAVTLGDPRGIGPEVAAKAARALRDRGASPELVFIGPEGTDAEAAADRFLSIGSWSGGDAASAGALAARAIREAVRLALAGGVDAIVTAPLDKRALHAAGVDAPGHTELLAALTRSADVAMMMVAERTLIGGPLRVVLATTHVALRSVPELVTTDLLVRQARLCAAALSEGWGIDSPRIALCALNPHASDGGLFGSEEADRFEPAVEALRAEGVETSGPWPADTVFLRTARGEFDAVVAPYHDVGMAAFKTAAFGHGVNVTLGLPFPRTSPDHGTALDIAGRGVADPSSMLEALELAARLSARRAAAGEVAR